MLEREIFQKMTAHARNSLQAAGVFARQYNSDKVLPEHLFLAILAEEGSLGSTILKGIGLKKDDLNKFLSAGKKREPKKTRAGLSFSGHLKTIITRSYALANSFGYPYVGTEHLVYALMESASAAVQEIIGKSGARDKPLDAILSANFNDDLFPNLSKLFDIGEISLAGKKSNRLSPTPYLDQFSVNVNDDAVRRNEIIVERDKEIDRLITILGRKNKNNPLLLGEPGVGKTAVVYGLANKLNSGSVPQNLLGKKILALDMALVVAGTSFRGEFEMRLKEIIKEAAEHREIILFIDELHNTIGAGNASGGLDAANILKPALSRGDIQCIGATTFGEYKKHIERDPALERRFQPVKIAEPTAGETKKILKKVKVNYEKFHNISISPAAIDQAVDLTVRYVPDRFLPDKALDVIDETASFIRGQKDSSPLIKEIRKLEIEKEKVIQQKSRLVQKENYEAAAQLRYREREIAGTLEELQKKQKGVKEASLPVAIAASDIARTISKITGIPPEKISARTSAAKIKNLQRNLNNCVIGQRETIKEIVNVLLRSYSGISNPDRPLGSFLFLGPTGVGKTLTAKALAREIFESPDSLVRIDMSEFMERHNVARLIGAPAGYVGYEEGGKLTEKIRHQPYSVVLFDEIEKAHPDVFNILLQVMEDGILTDAEGRQVSFKNTIIILTSNLGTSQFSSAASIGFRTQNETGVAHRFASIKNKVLEDLKKQVKPEILNRLDHIVVFNALGEKEIRKIAELELETLSRRLQKKGLTLNISPRIIDFIARKSMAAEYGARFVRKNIQDLVENEIAKVIIGNKVKDSRISLEVRENKISLV